MHPPRYQSPILASDRALAAFQRRMEHFRDTYGEWHAVPLIVEALAMVDAAIAARETAIILRLPPRQSTVPSGASHRSQPIRTVEY